MFTGLSLEKFKCPMAKIIGGKCIISQEIREGKTQRDTSCYYYMWEDSKRYYRASLVAQWLRICLPMQGTRVRALVWEDPTCRGATRPVSHNY